MTGEAKGGVEAAKWLGFALMVVDHANSYLLDFRYPVAFLLGRLVFPLFVLALAEGLARRGEVVASGTFRRLLLWGCIAQVPWSLLTGGSGLNVVFSLAFIVGANLAVFGTGAPLRRVLWGVGCTVGACLSEYGLAGLVFGLCAMWWRETGTRAGLVSCVGASALLYAVNGTWFGMLGIPVFVALNAWVELPRWRHAFYYLYPAHFLVLGFVRWWS